VASDLRRLAVEIVAAYVAGNATLAGQLPEIIRTGAAALASTTAEDQSTVVKEPGPAVPIRKSVTPDYLICLEDGKKMKMLKRHLRTTYGMTPEQYREKWRLPADYQMVAPNYAAQRSAFRKTARPRPTAPQQRVPFASCTGLCNDF
jgi:predicted transcriptional regulator